ncbi:hypothetical protein F0U61_49680 [Archangium violaceum]|uniref:hypothetical protein n=1 Tax=Archangium violaceum TaxID=83451 RepID=UPI002B3028E6|nr:hypothetical protein F0U61_49680 [Archangium violaceum]
MSTLPEALRPWAAQLSLFPEDLALSVGAHVARLAAALGPLRARNEREGGEPQGYDGLTRRGSPERLLMSEWLMALEAPDEFVRRAAFGEQAYLRVAHRQPQGGRRTVALLDAGPEQFGPPRIAHLALLVVLARRAEAVGASFAWGVLQSEPRQKPFSSVDAASVGQWLRAVSAVPPTEARLAEWREALEVGHAPDDVWLVGGARLSRLPGSERLSRVLVDEVVAPGARRLSVEVRPASRPARQVVLELPPVPQCVRLLRDPFEAAVAAPVLDTGTRAMGAIRFSADGLRLMLVSSDGSVAAQALPHSPRATTPKPKQYPPVSGEPLVAVGWRRSGGLISVTLRERSLCVYGALKGFKGRGVTFPLPDGMAPPRLQCHAGGFPLVLTQPHQDREVVLLLDAAGVLYQLDGEAGRGRTVSILDEGVTALAERRGALFYVANHKPEPTTGHSLQLGFWSPEKAWLRPLEVGGDGAAWFGHVNEAIEGEAGPLLVRHRGSGRLLLMQKLRCLGEQDKSPWRTEFLTRLVNVVGPGPCLPGSMRSLGLVMLEEDARTFFLVAENGTAERLVSAPARVVTASVSHAQPVLAWLTETGEVGVWNFQFRALVFRSTLGGRS